MRPILCLSVLLASSGWADELDDRASIAKTISTLNTSAIGATSFTADFNFAELERVWPTVSLWGIGPWKVVISDEPWVEAQVAPVMTVPLQAPPRLVIRSVRFITTDVALVDAVSESRDGTPPRRVPVLLVMRREGTDWRIASVRKVAQI